MIINGRVSQKVDWPSAWVWKYYIQKHMPVLQPRVQDDLPVREDLLWDSWYFPIPAWSEIATLTLMDCFPILFFSLHTSHSGCTRNVRLFVSKIIWQLFSLRSKKFRTFHQPQVPPWLHGVCHPLKERGIAHKTIGLTSNVIMTRKN